MIEQEMIKKVQIAKADIDIRGDGYGKIVIIVASIVRSGLVRSAIARPSRCFIPSEKSRNFFLPVSVKSS